MSLDEMEYNLEDFPDHPDLTVTLSTNSIQYPLCDASNTSVSNGSGFNSASTFPDNHVKRLLWVVFGPVILAVGVAGNLLVLVVMTQRRMRGTSTSVYLVAMAILDLTVLTVGLVPHWLAGASYIVLKELHPWTCKVEKFLDYTSGDAAVWVRVAFTLDRLVAVLCPLYTGPACGRHFAARTYIVASIVAAVVKNFHIFWTCGTARHNVSVCVTGENGTEVLETRFRLEKCYFPEPYKYFELYVRPWIAFALVSACPFIIIAISNTLIIVALVLRRRAMHHVRRSSSSSGKNERQFVQMAAMCVAASTLFLVCTAPSIVILIGKPYWNQPPGSNAAYEIAKAVSNLTFYVTFSANFFLYCITGDRFRSALKSTLRRCFCRGHHYISRNSLSTVRDQTSKKSINTSASYSSSSRPTTSRSATTASSTATTSMVLSRTSSSGFRKTAAAAGFGAVGSDPELREVDPSPPHPCDARVRSVVFAGNSKIADVGGLADGSSSPFIGRELWIQLLLSAPSDSGTCDADGKLAEGNLPNGEAHGQSTLPLRCDSDRSLVDGGIENREVMENNSIGLNNCSANGKVLPVCDVTPNVGETNVATDESSPSPTTSKLLERSSSFQPLLSPSQRSPSRYRARTGP